MTADPVSDHLRLSVSGNAVKVIAELHNAGFEAYIVGGAVRDLLLGMTPKDFDISTAASPEEVRTVFGRRNSRIIGKRFRLAHVYMGGELFEVSTFRKAPVNAGRGERQLRGVEKLPENLIVSDNSFGTAREDAWRRDFTINALFYEPESGRIIDHTGLGLSDIRSRVIRAIGDPALRFEEDPVRILRALKLVGQCDGFSLDDATENAIFRQMELIRHASPSRLSLELEKILESHCGDRHLQAFHDYGLLPYFLPEIENAWENDTGVYMRDLLFERNCRIEEGCFRNSISLALATVALPFVEAELGMPSRSLWRNAPGVGAAVRGVLCRIFRPQTMMLKVMMSAERILMLQPEFDRPGRQTAQLMQQRSYCHARELMLIRRAVAGEELARWEAEWPEIREESLRKRSRRRKR